MNLTKEDILKAHEALKSVVLQTPLQHNRYLSEKYQANIYLKREDLQLVRSFKLRGAYYAVAQLPKKIAQQGVVCASAGNHAQGVAFAARALDIPAMIFMPTTTPQQKIDQVAFFGGENVQISLTGDTFDESAACAKEFSTENAQTFIDPFDDKAVISGQGTIAVEIFDEAEKEKVKIDEIYCAIGGGGLISGVSAYSKALSPETKIIGCEPSGAASMQKAFEHNGPIALDELDKFVDGAAVQKVGQLPFDIAKQNVDTLTTVAEGQICSTILELYSKIAIVCEPAGALSVACLEARKEEIKGKNIVAIISGGNNDISRMAEIEERSLIYEGLKHYFVINFPQRPGALREFVNDIIGEKDDITRFEYMKKTSRGTGPVLIGILLKTKEEYPQLVKKLTAFDPHFINLQEEKTLYSLLV